MNPTRSFAAFLVIVAVGCLSICGLQAEDELDGATALLDLDGLATPDVQKLADQILKEPAKHPIELALGVLAHPQLNDLTRTRRLYQLTKDRVKAEHFELLRSLPLLQDAATNPPAACLVLRLIGRSRHPEAKALLIENLKNEHASLRGAAAYGLGLLGDKTQLAVLQREYDRARGAAAAKEYADGLVKGMLLLGDARYLPALLTETASVAGSISEAVLTLASGYTTPQQKYTVGKTLAPLRERYAQLQDDLTEIAPLHPQELARYIVSQTDPGTCDVLYRLLPRLITAQNAAAFIPVLKAQSPDLRQLVLDLLLAAKPQPADQQAIQQLVQEWARGQDGIGRFWAIRNAGVLVPAERQQLLLGVLKTGNRWERVAALDDIRRTPDPELVAAARALAVDDPDVRFHLGRLLAAATRPAP